MASTYESEFLTVTSVRQDKLAIFLLNIKIVYLQE